MHGLNEIKSINAWASELAARKRASKALAEAAGKKKRKQK